MNRFVNLYNKAVSDGVPGYQATVLTGYLRYILLKKNEANRELCAEYERQFKEFLNR